MSASPASGDTPDLAAIRAITGRSLVVSGYLVNDLCDAYEEALAMNERLAVQVKRHFDALAVERARREALQAERDALTGLLHDAYAEIIAALKYAVDWESEAWGDLSAVKDRIGEVLFPDAALAAVAQEASE